MKKEEENSGAGRGWFTRVQERGPSVSMVYMCKTDVEALASYPDGLAQSPHEGGCTKQ